MKRGTKKVFAWAMTFALLLSLVPAMGVTALANPAGDDGTIAVASYLDKNRQEHIVEAIPVTSNTKEWTGTSASPGWYVVDNTVTISGSVTVSGEVHLILTDGKTLSVKNIVVNSGNSLTIYGQSAGSGQLTTSTPAEGSAGIGGTNGVSNGPITINGGTVTATGGKYGAGIGGGNGATGTGITINGGTVTATGKGGAAGIGGGDFGAGNNIIINGGTVTATGTYQDTGGYSIGGGAGIGGGRKGSGSDITINGGTVTAYGGKNGSSESKFGAGIGGGGHNNGCGAGKNIKITNGTVTAYGGLDAAGIGGSGYTGVTGGNGEDITISGGTVTATGGNCGAGIGGGNRAAGTRITITGGDEIKATGGVQAAGIGGGSNGSGTEIAITGGKVTATGGNKSSLGIGSGIGGGSADKGGFATASSIKVAAFLELKADNNNPPKTLITPHSSTTDSAGDLKGKRYVTTTPHTTHTWKYVSSTTATDTITRSCTIEGCPETGGTMTIKAPAELRYDGQAKVATVTSTMEGETIPTVKYSKQGESTSTETAPTQIGSYTASITMGEVTASVSFEIITGQTHSDISGPIALDKTQGKCHLYFKFNTEEGTYMYGKTIQELLKEKCGIVWEDIAENGIVIKVEVTDLAELEQVTVTLGQ